MIIGIGSDMTDIRRIEKTLRRFGDRFTARCFSAAEMAAMTARKKGGHREAGYAKRFAAKEALAKALGIGIGRHGLLMREISVENDAYGKPVMRLHGAAARIMAEKTPSGHQAHLHLSLSDEYPYAQAFVVIEARPDA